MTNARDALRDVERKLIRISSAIEGDTLRIVLQDTGAGIPPELEHRVFDPFFTTKDVGEGTGLGLSITYGIIRDHLGTIEIHNCPGEGVAFVIQLPLPQGSETSVAL